MPYTPHTLLAFGGRLPEAGAAGEVWECTLRGGSANLSTNTALAPFGTANLDRLADDVAGALATWWANTSNGIPNVVLLDYVKANNIKADGTYAEPTTHLSNIVPAVAGPLGPQAPSFCSVAGTFETGLERGRAHRGRMYLPNPSYAYQGALLSSGTATQVRDTYVSLLNAIIQAPNEGTLEDTFRPAVMSRLDASWHWITAVTVDNVYDVQRRRKNQAPSTRTAPANLTF